MVQSTQSEMLQRPWPGCVVSMVTKGELRVPRTKPWGTPHFGRKLKVHHDMLLFFEKIWPEPLLSNSNDATLTFTFPAVIVLTANPGGAMAFLESLAELNNISVVRSKVGNSWSTAGKSSCETCSVGRQKYMSRTLSCRVFVSLKCRLLTRTTRNGVEKTAAYLSFWFLRFDFPRGICVDVYCMVHPLI